MRAFVLLSILGLAAAGPSLADQGDCLVDGAGAVSDAMDSAMFIWASLARCGHAGETIKCEIAVASAVESVNGMINVILKAVDKCHGLDVENKKCGLAASKLTRGMAGLAAASGGIIQKCPSLFGGANHGNNFAHGDAVSCTVNLKSTAKALFKAIKALMKISKDSKDVGNALKLVQAFAGLGQYLAGALGHCTHSLNEGTLGCAEHISALTRQLAKVAEGGVKLSKECGGDDGGDAAPEAPATGGGGGAAAPEAPAAPSVEEPTVVEVQVPRLYEDDKDDKKKKDEASAPIYTNLVLGAFLPVTAVVSFVVGRVFAMRRERITQSREFMSDNE